MDNQIEVPLWIEKLIAIAKANITKKEEDFLEKSLKEIKDLDPK